MFSRTTICGNNPSRLRSSVTIATPARRTVRGLAEADQSVIQQNRSFRGFGAGPNRHSSNSVRPAPMRPATPSISPRCRFRVMSFSRQVRVSWPAKVQMVHLQDHGPVACVFFRELVEFVSSISRPTIR